MPDPLPPEIHVRRVADSVAYDLPRRPLGGMRAGAVFMVIFGAVFAAAPVTTAAVQLIGSGRPEPMDWIFAVFSLGFLLAGGLVGLVGLVLLRGRTSVVLRPDRLVAVERLGPLRWSRRRDPGGLCGIEVHRGTTRVNGRTVTEGAAAEMAAIKAEFTGAPPFVLALGYPMPWLTAVAERIKTDLPTVCPASLFEDDDEVPVKVVTASPEAQPERPASKPADTAVTVTENADGLTVTIPPAGVWKAGKGLFTFSLLWCGFMAVFTTLVIVGPVLHGGLDNGVWFFAAFVAAFWAVGIGMMLGAVNMGRRHAIIDVVDDVLLVNRRNLFGIKSHQWTRDELTTVTVGPSGMEVNGMPVANLKIRPAEGGDVGLFAGRDEAELRWIASVVRQRLWPNKIE